MSAWWRERTSRERALLVGLAVVLSAALVQFGLVSPLREARAEAVAALEDADDLLTSVRAAVASGRADKTAPVGAAVSVREAIIGYGRSRGLAITRLTPLDDGALTVRIDRVEARALHEWLAALERDRGVGVRQAVVRRAGGGAVSADVTFERVDP